jgi:hypothetical protein
VLVFLDDDIDRGMPALFVAKILPTGRILVLNGAYLPAGRQASGVYPELVEGFWFI